MAEIKYSGVPQKFTAGPGARTQNKWADFLGAELPMGLIKSLPLVGNKRQQLVAALMKLLQEEEEKQNQSGVVPMPGPGFGPQATPFDRVGLLNERLSASPTFDMTKFGD